MTYPPTCTMHQGIVAKQSCLVHLGTRCLIMWSTCQWQLEKDCRIDNSHYSTLGQLHCTVSFHVQNKPRKRFRGVKFLRFIWSMKLFLFLTVDGYNMGQCLERFWLPRYQVSREPGIVGCTAVSIRSSRYNQTFTSGGVDMLARLFVGYHYAKCLY